MTSAAPWPVIDPAKSVRLVLNQIAVEGSWRGGPALLHLNPLQKINLVIQGIQYPSGILEGPLGQSAVSRRDGYEAMRVYQLREQCKELGLDAEGGAELLVQRLRAAATVELVLRDWRVKGEPVTMENYDGASLGRLSIDEAYRGQWRIE